jgi:ring-1,2-phenylacetyl-CoA epoxidase subunit PaaE
MTTGTQTRASRPGTAHFHPLKIAEIERLTEDAVAITFDVPDELRQTYQFVQGQHVAIRCSAIGDEVRRNYSVCSSAASGTLRVAVKRLEGGAFSNYAVSTLRPGCVLEVLPPHGGFFTPLDPRQRKHYAAVAAGSGITPILSLISTSLEVEPKSRFTLFYGNKSTKSIMFLEELEDLKNRYPERFVLHHVLSRERRGIEIFDGRIDGERLHRFCSALVPVEEVDDWFLCGPMAMVEELAETLESLGVAARQTHRELFFSGVAGSPSESTLGVEPSLGRTCRLVFRLDGRESTIEFDADKETILDGALRARADAPYACRGGVCATCRAKLLEGKVEMTQDYALEQDQKEAGYVLTCQARPKTELVVVDYDA